MEWTVETVFPRGQRVGVGRVRGLWLDGHFAEGIRLTELTMQSTGWGLDTSCTAMLDFEIPSDRHAEFLVSDPEIRTVYRDASYGGSVMEVRTFISSVCLRLKLRDRTFRCSAIVCDREMTKVKLEMGCANLRVIDGPIDTLGWVKRRQGLAEQLAFATNHRNYRLISDEMFLKTSNAINKEMAYIQRQIELVALRDPDTQSRVFQWEDAPVERVDSRFLQGMMWTHSQELKSQAIGDTTCLNNANSKHLRCAVNPSGPCEGCKFYEKN